MYGCEVNMCVCDIYTCVHRWINLCNAYVFLYMCRAQKMALEDQYHSHSCRNWSSSFFLWVWVRLASFRVLGLKLRSICLCIRRSQFAESSVQLPIYKFFAKCLREFKYKVAGMVIDIVVFFIKYCNFPFFNLFVFCLNV